MNKMTMTLMFILLAIPLAYAGDWVRPLVAAGSSLWSEGLGGAIYYDGGYVGIGVSSPSETLEVSASLTDPSSNNNNTVLVLDSLSGTHDSALSFYNQGQKEFDICMDDSSNDELKFIRGGNIECAGKDTFTMTAYGMEMGTAMLYFDSPTRWYRTPCCSSIGNNFFEFDKLVGGLDLETLTGGQQGQRITIICTDTESIVWDEAGNINLNNVGDFDCAVEGVGSTLELIYFDDVDQPYEWSETSRSSNNP